MISLDALIRLRSTAYTLTLRLQGLALSKQAGGLQSKYQGRGLEFDEVRAYQAGDDVRDIDWRVTARRGQTHIKLFRAERERPVILLSDLGPGMFFGSQVLKSVQAIRTAALIAWAAEHAGDRVGGIIVSRDGHTALPPMPRRHAVLRLLRKLYQLQPRIPAVPQPDLLNQGLARLTCAARPGSLLVILSDFQSLDTSGEQYLIRLAQHHTLLLIQIYDPLEVAPPRSGRYRLGVPGQIIHVDTNSTDGARWRQSFEARQAQLTRLSRHPRCHFLPLASGDDAMNMLRRTFSRRVRTR